MRPHRLGARAAARGWFEHMQALPHQEVAGSVAAVRASGGAEVVKLAFELLVLTVARWGEVRGAQWSEFDVAGRVWTVPAERMKANRAHRVPLCGRAMEILDAARSLGEGHGQLVFPGRRGTQLAEKGLRRLLQRLEIAAVPHGFRSTFRAGRGGTEHRREVIRRRGQSFQTRSRRPSAVGLFSAAAAFMDGWVGESCSRAGADAALIGCPPENRRRSAASQPNCSVGLSAPLSALVRPAGRASIQLHCRLRWDDFSEVQPKG